MCAIYDIMQFIKSPVCTYAIGLAASAAAVLLASGTKGKRYSLPNSQIMIHQPWSGVDGTVTDISIQFRELSRYKKKITAILAAHTGKTYEQVERDCERDYFMTPNMAVKYGLIDSITEVTKQIPEVTHDNKYSKRKR